jgi:hypothetical protein
MNAIIMETQPMIKLCHRAKNSAPTKKPTNTEHIPLARGKRKRGLKKHLRRGVFKFITKTYSKRIS